MTGPGRLRIQRLAMVALVSTAVTTSALAQASGTPAGMPTGRWTMPSSMQPIPFTSRGSWVSMPFVRQSIPWNHAQGGNRPAERTLPDRFNPNLPGPTPPPPVPAATVPQDPAGGSGQGQGGPNPTTPIDPIGAGGVIELPTGTGISLGSSGGGISVGMGTNWGWNGSGYVHQDASSGYQTGWNSSGTSYGSFDPRLSTHFKPSELKEMQAQAQAEASAAKLTLSERGYSALLRGDYELADQFLSEQLRETPEDMQLIRTLGVIDLLRKRTDAGIKRIGAAYSADPLLCDTPIDASIYAGGESTLRRVASEVASIAARAGKADAALVAAVLAQARGDTVVANRFIDRAAASGLDATLVARFRATIVPKVPGKRAESVASPTGSK